MAAVVAIFVSSVAEAQQFGVMPDARHMFIIRQDGMLITWGKGLYGNLGIGSLTDQDTATRVLKGQYSGTAYFGDNTANPVIDAGGDPYHSVAVTSDGIAYAWGDNTGGQIGDGTTTQRWTPVKVRAGQYGGTYLGENSTNKIIMIRGGSSSTIGHSYSVALSKSGLVYAWGFGDRGQTGRGNLTVIQSTPVKVRAGQYGSGRVYLGDLSTNKIVAISAGEEAFTLALAQDGMLYSWGYGGNGTCASGGKDGRLGNGSTINQSLPIRVRAGSMYGTGRTYLGDMSTNPVVAISTGGSISMAMTQDGALYAWGLGCAGTQGEGKLGNNTQQSTSLPIRVLAGQYGGTYLGENTTNSVREIKTGGRTAGILTTGNQIYVWAENNEGQVGDGTTTLRSIPVRTLMGIYPGMTYFGDSPSDTITSIAISERNGFALTQAGHIYSWGNDPNAELGDCAVHTPTYMSIPVRVKGNYAGLACQDLILPISLTSFDAKLRGADIQLDWHTVSEIRSYAMEVERLTEGSEVWDRVSVIPGHGTTNVPHDYTYRDNISGFLNLLPLTLAYRIKCVDMDGSYQYSDMLKVELQAPSSELVLNQNIPNPFSDFTNISYSIPREAYTILELFDVNGTLMKTYLSRELESGFYKQTLATDEDWVTGTYYLKLTSGNKSVTRAIKIVQ